MRISCRMVLDFLHLGAQTRHDTKDRIAGSDLYSGTGPVPRSMETEVGESIDRCRKSSSGALLEAN